jgi:hypothetical protein
MHAPPEAAKRRPATTPSDAPETEFNDGVQAKKILAGDADGSPDRCAEVFPGGLRCHMPATFGRYCRAHAEALS